MVLPDLCSLLRRQDGVVCRVNDQPLKDGGNGRLQRHLGCQVVRGGILPQGVCTQVQTATNRQGRTSLHHCDTFLQSPEAQ